MTFTQADPKKTRVGWIGTGVMGRSMCQHLMRRGYQTTIHTRTPKKAKDLLAEGAAWADSPQALAGRSDVIFTMLGYPHDVREILLGESGIFPELLPGSVVVDMTTSEPSLAREISETVRARGADSLDAPVSGGDVGAQRASLSIMVGGERRVFEAVLPLFSCMGETIVHQGPAGAGQHTKMVNQILIATNMIGVSEGLLYGYRAGLDLPTVLRSVGGGAAASWSLQNLAPRIIDRNFEPGFFVEHFIKDMGIALEEARRMNLCLPGLALAQQLYIALKAQGHARSGTQALMLALETISNVKR